MAEQFVLSSIALHVNVAVDIVGIHDGAQAAELLNHLVDAAQEQHQLDIVDKQQRQFVDKRLRVLTTEINSV